MRSPASRSMVVAATLLLSMVMSPNAAMAAGHPCAEKTDPVERLACYDRDFPPVAAVLPSKAERRLREDRARAEFGLQPSQVRARQGVGTAEVDRVEATLASVQQLGTGERLVTLDNGQKWLLTEVTSKGHLEPGDSVVIRRAALGSYLMLVPRQGSLRVRRVQ